MSPIKLSERYIRRWDSIRDSRKQQVLIRPFLRLYTKKYNAGAYISGSIDDIIAGKKF